MNMTLLEVITDFMSCYGGDVSPSGDNILEYLATKDLSDALKIPEFGKIGFSRQQEQGAFIYASYDSDLISSMKEYLAHRGAISTASYPMLHVNVDKFSQQILKSLSFTNATFHIVRQQTQDVGYDLVFFKYTATSDDKQEGLVAILRNILNSSMAVVSRDALGQVLEQIQELPKGTFFTSDIEKSILQARNIAFVSIKQKTQDFVKSLEKRLNRDIQRVHEYYTQLAQDTRKLLIKAQADGKEETVDRLQVKVDAIAAERKWKIQDMASKYALAVTVDPVIVIRITVLAPVFWINIKRRLDTREIALTYNPISKQLDSMPCESCFASGWDRSVCDTRFHLVCCSCLSICQKCSKKFCRACWLQGCPRCNMGGSPKMS